MVRVHTYTSNAWHIIHPGTYMSRCAPIHPSQQFFVICTTEDSGLVPIAVGRLNRMLAEASPALAWHAHVRRFMRFWSAWTLQSINAQFYVKRFN